MRILVDFSKPTFTHRSGADSGSPATALLGAVLAAAIIVALVSVLMSVQTLRADQTIEMVANPFAETYSAPRVPILSN